MYFIKDVDDDVLIAGLIMIRISVQVEHDPDFAMIKPRPSNAVFNIHNFLKIYFLKIL